MRAATKDIYIEQGSTFKTVLTLQDDSAVPIDLTGWTFRGSIKKTLSGASGGSFSFELFDQTTDPGKVYWIMTDAVTEAIEVSAGGSTRKLTTFLYDIEAVKPDGEVQRLFEGTASVSPEVTTNG